MKAVVTRVSSASVTIDGAVEGGSAHSAAEVSDWLLSQETENSKGAARLFEA